MHSNTWFAQTGRSLLTVVALFITVAWPAEDVRAQDQRPMTFLDMQHLNRGGSWTPSPNGDWMLYTVTEPDWEDDERQTDIHLVSLREGVTSHRQMTYTDSKNETSPQWSRDGSLFAFLSNRESQGENGGNQIFVMPPDGGEARRITDAAGGVSNFRFSPDGSALVFRAGEGLDNELYRISMSALFDGDAEAITETEAGINGWEWSPDGDKIYFITPDQRDRDEERRMDAGFTVDIRNAETPLASLWVLDVASQRASRLTNDGSYTVAGLTVSDDGRWVGYRGISSERYERNITEQGINADLYLLEVATGDIERLTNNDEVGEQGPSFSPDGQWIAFAAPRNMQEYSFDARKVFVRAVDDRGGDFRRLGDEFEEHMSVGFWSDDSETIYFNAGVRARRALMALDVASGEVEAVTDEDASLRASRHDDGTLLIDYADPRTPPTVFTVARVDDLGRRDRWVQLVDLNPQVKNLALGEESEVTWTSTDGHQVSGVLVKPVGYQEGTRYPLIVAIHGGPASADVLGFNGGYGSQVYAGAGYAVLRPNYRGSTNYGEEFRVSIAGNYFPQAFDDIMAGVDHLIAEGIVDGDRMGALGWSAGGHWSNWILTHTDRFKAISSGAGTMNWISMYAQSDVQRNRQFYLGNELMYENFDPYWDQSPLKYIANASTPTMVHVVEGDPRVPSPQSVELHMALKKLEVPTELFMYPGQSHGIPDPRNRLVKSVSEMAWMDYYVRGLGDKFDWRQVLETLPEEERPRAATDDAGGR